MLKFGNKIAFFGYFLDRISKNCCYISNQHPPTFCNYLILGKDKKCLNLGQKILSFFGYFLARITKQYCYFRNQHPEICLTAKFPEKKQKCINLGQKMSYLGIFGMKFENSIVIFEINTLKFV